MPIVFIRDRGWLCVWTPIVSNESIHLIGLMSSIAMTWSQNTPFAKAYTLTATIGEYLFAKAYILTATIGEYSLLKHIPSLLLLENAPLLKHIHSLLLLVHRRWWTGGGMCWSSLCVGMGVFPRRWWWCRQDYCGNAPSECHFYSRKYTDKSRRISAPRCTRSGAVPLSSWKVRYFDCHGWGFL